MESEEVSKSLFGVLLIKASQIAIDWIDRYEHMVRGIEHMRYHLYLSNGNAFSVDEHVAYSETRTDGYCVRYLEIRATGMALRYSENHGADAFGQLPDAALDEQEASKPEYGVFRAISRELFYAVWNNTSCGNDRFQGFEPDIDKG